MNIFKTYLKQIPSNLGFITMYIVIFIVILTLSMNSGDNVSAGTGSIDGFKTLAAVQDLDDTPESRELISYLENDPNITLVDDIDFDRENAVQDSLYYRKIEYLLIINKGYGDKLKAGQTDGLLSSEVVGGSSEMFMNSRLDSYISAVSLYITGGYDSETASAEAAKRLEQGVEISSYQLAGGWNEDSKRVYLFYNYIPYILIMMILPTLVPTFNSFLNGDMRSRTLCSPINAVAYMAQVIGGAFIICLAAMAVLLVAGLFLTEGKLFNEMAGYSVLQMFVFMLFCLALAGLVSILCNGAKKTANYVTSMVSNVVGLGMSFLCGVFVPQSLLGEEIINVGKFLPAYWYVRGNNMIMGGDGAVFDETQIWLSIGVQALFAAAVFSVALLTAGIRKGKKAG